VNKKDNHGHTPLLIAACKGHVKVVIELLSSDKIKIDKNLQEKIVNLLKEANANINTVMENGETLLYVASKKGYVKMVETLWQNGADMNLGKSPLVGVIANGHNSIANFLLQKGIKVTEGTFRMLNPKNAENFLNPITILGKRKQR
jgi:ankyrin repeat protein